MNYTHLHSLVPKTSARLRRPTKKENEVHHSMVNTCHHPRWSISLYSIINPVKEPMQNARLVVVALKQLQEARLRSRCALHSAETQVGARALHVTQVHEQVLDPERGSLADRRQLRRPENIAAPRIWSPHHRDPSRSCSFNGDARLVVKQANFTPVHVRRTVLPLHVILFATI